MKPFQPLFRAFSFIIFFSPYVSRPISQYHIEQIWNVSDESTRKRIAQNIVGNLVNEKFEAVRTDFSGALKSQLSAQNIEDVWFNVTTQLGKFEKVDSIRTAVSQGYNQVFSRCKFVVDSVTIEVGFNEEDKVIALLIKP